MLATEIKDTICWWQVWDVDHFVIIGNILTSHLKNVTNINIRSSTLSQQDNVVTNVIVAENWYKTWTKAQLREQLNSIRAASGRSRKTPDTPKTPAEKKAELLKKFSVSDDLLVKQQETDTSEPVFGQSESGNAKNA